MKALITGASSGLGADMARELASQGHEIILVARRKGKLEKLEKELEGSAKVIVMDISSTYNCMDLYNKVKNENIDILINNAGFGLFGEFVSSSIDKELDMIDLNIKSVHTLTKLFLKDFKKRDSGYILNVASSAGFLPGPLMSTYYASKAYVLNFSQAIYEELRREGSHVKISVLCPGPVDTEFNKVANVSFGLKSLKSDVVAKYSIKQLFKNKMIIIPGFKMKLSLFFIRFLPRKILLRTAYNLQSRKK